MSPGQLLRIIYGFYLFFLFFNYSNLFMSLF